MIERVIVDIGLTKWFPVDLFSAYMALSRSRGWATIRLLQDFDDNIFTKHPSEALCLEDERLLALAKETMIKYKSGGYDY